jgi:integrase
VPLASRVAAELKLALEEHPTGLLFVDSRGGPLRRAHVRRRTWMPAVTAAKIGAPFPRWHDLRHTCASWLVQAGVPILEVSRILGHSNVTVTQPYAHLAPDQYDRVLEALDR